MVVSCPAGSHSEIANNCGMATEKNPKPVVNVRSAEILLYIPVTAPDEITYANVYCSLCNDAANFTFWHIDVSNISKCFRDILTWTVRIGTVFDPTLWQVYVEQVPGVSDSQDCKAEGTLLPYPRKGLIKYLGNTPDSRSRSRFSKYCLNVDYFLDCNNKEEESEDDTFDFVNQDRFQLMPRHFNPPDRAKEDETQDSILNSHGKIKRVNNRFITGGNIENPSSLEGASNVKVRSCNMVDDQGCNRCNDSNWQTYQICKSMEDEFIRCDCSINKCLSEFSLNIFENTFTNAARQLFGNDFTLRILFEGSGVSTMEYENQQLSFNYFLVPFSCDVCIGNESCLHDPMTPRPEICFFPNPVVGKCLEYPCLKPPVNQSATQSATQSAIQSATHLENALTEYLLFSSIISLSATIIIILFLPELQTNYSYFQVNYYVTYLLSNIFLFISASVTSMPKLCMVSAILLHLSIMSSFAWMIVTGSFILRCLYLMNRHIGIVGPNGAAAPQKSLKLFIISHVIGHFLPAFFILICILRDLWLEPGVMGYGQGSFCWIGDEKSIIFWFIIPTGILLSFNLIIFLGCTFFLTYFQLKNRNANISQHVQTIFVLVKLLVGLGLQWSFGIAVRFYPENLFTRYIFIVSVSVHGVLILLCTLSQKVVRRKFTETCIETLQKAKSVFVSSGINNNVGPPANDNVVTV